MTVQIEIERDRIVSDIASVEKALAELQLKIAERRIAPQRAELAAAQINDEIRRLTVRLTDLDASIAIKQAAPDRWRGGAG